MSFYSPIAYPIPLQKGGLGADVSAYNGLVYIASGAAGQAIIGDGVNFDLVTGTLSSNTRVSVDGTLVGSRQHLNFIAGAGILISGVDNSVNDRVDLQFSCTGGGVTPAPSSTSQVVRPVEIMSPIGDGVTDTFYISDTIENGQEHVYVNGVLQYTSKYSVVGNSVVFTTPPSLGSLVMITNWVAPPAVSAARITQETPGGVIDGVNDTFTLANTPAANTTRLWMGLSAGAAGILQYEGVDYTIAGSTITFTTPPPSTMALRCSYWINGTAYTNSVFGEVPGGAVNGVNTAFTLTDTPYSSAALNFYLNGLLEIPGTDYSVAGAGFNTTIPPSTGADLMAFFDVGSSVGGASSIVLGYEPPEAVDGVNDTFSLPVTPVYAAVYVDGHRMFPTTDYSLSGTDVVFVAPPPASSELLVDYAG